MWWEVEDTVSDKRRDKYLPLVISLVESALGLSRKMIYTAETDTEFNRLIELKSKPKVIWIRRRVERDQLYQFWMLKKLGALPEECWVIFTGIDETPLWVDLREYPGGRFGSIFVIRYDGRTQVGVKPSQRGIFMQ